MALVRIVLSDHKTSVRAGPMVFSLLSMVERLRIFGMGWSAS